MIKKIWKIPTTKDSHPFIAAADACGFEAAGYAEDEYFMSGTANVYGEDRKGIPFVEIADAPYTTRMLIRRPKDINTFSGNIVIEMLNPTALHDIDRIWMNGWKYFIRNGDIYIGITSKGQVVPALQKFDPQRYAEMNWSNPDKTRIPPQSVLDNPMAFMEEYESGLLWDMLIDFARLLRQKSQMNPVAEYGKCFLYLSGWSQCGCFLNRMLKSFAYLPEIEKDGALFDGYFSAGYGAGPAPINAYSEYPIGIWKDGIPEGNVLGAKQPLIAVNTDSESRFAYWYGDFDEPEFKFRTWQIPGSSHDTRYNLQDYFRGSLQDDLKKIDAWADWERMGVSLLEVPYEPIFCAAWFHLYRWVREQIPAPHAPSTVTILSVEKGGSVNYATDLFGNTKGGIRHPAVEYPTAKAVDYSILPDGSYLQMVGHSEPFSAEKLKQLYGSLENYRALVERSADKMIAGGFLLLEDRQEMVERVVNAARERGLTEGGK